MDIAAFDKQPFRQPVDDDDFASRVNKLQTRDSLLGQVAQLRPWKDSEAVRKVKDLVVPASHGVTRLR